MMKELAERIDERVKERRAMGIAMKKEQQVEQSLRNTAKRIVDLGVRAVFDQMACLTKASCIHAS